MEFWILRKTGLENEKWDAKLDAYYSGLCKIKKFFFDWELVVYSSGFSHLEINENGFVDGVISRFTNENIDGDCRQFVFEEDTVRIRASYYCRRQCYYYLKNAELFFANDIRSIMLNEVVEFKVSEEACKHYATSYCLYEEQSLPYNLSFFENIYKMDNNSCVLKDDVLLYKEKLSRTKQLMSFPLREILKSEIKAYGLEEKVGISLSGGIDSACVLQAMLDAGYKSNQIIAFTMTFSDKELVNTNDVEIVKKIAEHYGIKVYIIDGNETLDFIDYENDVIDTIDGPSVIANHKFLSTVRYLCIRNNINLLFDGCGGDELLGGTTYVFDDMVRRKPIKALSELWKQGKKIYALERIRYFVIEPLFFPWLYQKRLWGEKEKVNFDFFSKEQYNRERQTRDLLSKQHDESKNLKSWGKRFVYDFSKDVPGALQEKFDGLMMASPLYRETLRAYAISANCEELFDYSKLPNSYLASKKIMREVYRDVLPKCVSDKEIKTTYCHMARKMYINMYKRILPYFRDNQSEIGRMNIIDNQQFYYSLIRMRILCEETSTNVGLDYNYISGLCKLEEWLQWCKYGREYILEKCKPYNILNNEEVLPYEEI